MIAEAKFITGVMKVWTSKGPILNKIYQKLRMIFTDGGTACVTFIVSSPFGNTSKALQSSIIIVA